MGGAEYNCEVGQDTDTGAQQIMAFPWHQSKQAGLNKEESLLIERKKAGQSR